MPFPMKIQPIDAQALRESSRIRNDIVLKPVLKSRLKRLFDRPFNSVSRISTASAEKPTTGKDVAEYFELSSVCLAKMVQNFMEESNEKPTNQTPVKCGRNRCNCFNGNDSSDDEFDFFDSFSASNHSSFTDFSDSLKCLIPCASTAERNLLADTSKIVEKNKTCKRKNDLRKVVTDGLLALGYDSSICKSKWDKSSSIPAGGYEYIEVMIEGERILVDLDFRSEFEIARSTSSYKTTLQLLPYIFVGKADRLLQIILIVSEAARLSLKKKGMHIAPWRKVDYIKAKWFSPFTRITPLSPPPKNSINEVEAQSDAAVKENKAENQFTGVEGEVECDNISRQLDLIFGKKPTLPEIGCDEGVSDGEKPISQPNKVAKENKIVVTGLASLLKEKP